MLNEEQVRMVQADWRSVLPIASQAATLFYDRLFELDSGLRPLFKPDLTEQKAKLLQMLSAAVKGLDDLPSLVPAVQALGRRHVEYGVKPQHYDTVGAALLWTLRKGLGDGFDGVHEVAWTEVYTILSQTMIAAAEGRG
jgi:hemoglobin-like flavoprotein